MQTTWSRYIDVTSAGDLNSTIAEKAKVDPATIGRWRSGAVAPKPRQVVEYARAYGHSPIAALIAADFLTKEEAGMEVFIPNTTLADFSTTALADELSRRLHADREGRSVINQFPQTTDLGDSDSPKTINS